MADPMASAVHEKAQHALDTSPIRILRDLRVDRTDSALVLSGRVDSFYQKQLAQELVRSVATGCELINSISVT